ncbi:MAG: MBL fold metallo-hydrolase [Ignavibacteriae bacterium]|nr:MBL fold metallo-hydrolase [Ignavibacteriota bacterium]
MADVRKQLSENVKGEFFVDSTCINCDVCRQLAPETFGEADDFSYVYAQPQTDEQWRRALRALLACPTGSIGTLGTNNSKQVINDFPIQIENEVYYCGFNSPKSYGGNSYFIKHADGNWLIDSPKFLPHLVRKFEEVGGLKYIFLTHRDDVAEAHRYATKFNAKRIIHRFELSSQPASEIVIDGDKPVQLFPEFLTIPTSGHTKGHCVLLYKNYFLFTGDHLWWSRKRNSLSASEEVCWYSWPDQIKSMEKLLQFRFERVLPGHGQRMQLSSHEMHQHLTHLVARMKSSHDVDNDKSWSDD